MGNARSRVRGGWKRRIAPCRNPSSTTHLAACKTLGKQTKRALTATHQKVNRLTHHIHIPAKILVRPDPPKKQAGVPPPQAKCSSHLVSSSSSGRLLPETPQKTTPASSKAPRARPPVRPENQAKPRAVPVEGHDAPARDAHRPERAAGAPHREERAVRAVRAAVARRGAGAEAARDVRAAAPLLLCVAQVALQRLLDGVKGTSATTQARRLRDAARRDGLDGLRRPAARVSAARARVKT